MWKILAYVHLVEHKAVLSLAFSDYQCRPPFYLIRQWPHHSHTYSFSRRMHRDIRIRIRDSNARHSGNGSQRLRVRVERLKVQPGDTTEGLTKATACG